MLNPGGFNAGWWLFLVGALGAELFYAFGLFDFSAITDLGSLAGLRFLR